MMSLSGSCCTCCACNVYIGRPSAPVLHHRGIGRRIALIGLGSAARLGRDGSGLPGASVSHTATPASTSAKQYEQAVDQCPDP